jgi:hypothetical protein
MYSQNRFKCVFRMIGIPRKIDVTQWKLYCYFVYYDFFFFFMKFAWIFIDLLEGDILVFHTPERVTICLSVTLCYPRFNIKYL